MNNLKKKILTLLISILSIFLISLIIIFNFSIYNRESKKIKDKFIRLNNTHEKFDYNHNANLNPIFIDNEIYFVTFNISGDIDKIISYSSSGLNDNEIKELITKNIHRIKTNKIGSLYKNDYLLFSKSNRTLIILNNQETKSYLLKLLIESIILFIIIECIIVYLSYVITKWIVKPVDEAFINQKQFIYDASHELKTPIAIIQASAETLENNPKEKKWLENIKSETSRMNKLVTNLLELSKSEELKNNEIYTSINLSKLVRSKALSFESLIFENNLSLNTEIEKDIILNCNGDRIKELISILIDNAIKHGIKGSKIEVNLHKEKNNIILFVKNRGKEIPIEERKKIFERFYRIDKSRNRDENRYGLGLSIAKNIVNSHNGNIKVECKDGYTIFIITFKQD